MPRGPSYSQSPRAGFAHAERKSRPVRALSGFRGTIDDVIAARIFPQRVALVARRHVDFKRVCTCCCLP
ncbi:Ms4527A family Cys-rich leader peptide [Mycobacterium sp.]|uniref:Ms4527A family Cys-rich leader peptide n=1 Tax=Mycobacterium sp. TaxID=1785 RepID=UPI003342D673